jgi:hypothetical protein
MTLTELVAAVADMITDYPILTAVISFAAVVGGVRALIKGVKSAAK